MHWRHVQFWCCFFENTSQLESRETEIRDDWAASDQRLSVRLEQTEQLVVRLRVELEAAERTLQATFDDSTQLNALRPQFDAIHAQLQQSKLAQERYRRRAYLAKQRLEQATVTANAAMDNVDQDFNTEGAP
jgi:hypothetical protein